MDSGAISFATLTSVAYLVGQYPAISHTFIDREIQSLRGYGVAIETISVRPVADDQILTEHDRSEHARTWTILPPSPRHLVGAHARLALRSPRKYLRTLRLAFGLGSPGARGTAWKLFYFLEAGLVADRIRRQRINHLHAHFANSASWITLLAAELGDVTWSFSMHGPHEFEDVAHYALAAKAQRAEFVACIGDFARAQLMRLVPPSQWDKLIVVRCGVAGTPHRTLERRAAPSHDVLKVLCVGRLVPEKGQRVLVEAVSVLNGSGLRAQLTLVGDGPDRDALRAFTESVGASSFVTFAGSVGQDRIGDYYADADIFALASFAEGIPVVLMEAMSHGLPVIATSIMGIDELVEDGDSGYLVQPGRTDQLVNAIRGLAADPELRDRLGRAGRDRVGQEFTHPEVARRLADRFNEL